MGDIDFVSTAYYQLFGGAVPTKEDIEANLDPDTIYCFDHDNGFKSNDRGDIADHLRNIALNKEVKDHPPATFREQHGYVFCMDHMTRMRAGSCVDRIQVGPSGKIIDIRICYVQGT